MVEESWQRIVAWFEANTPRGTLLLPPGASETAIRKAERETGLTLPGDLRAFYRLHDGLGEKGFLHYGEFKSLRQLVSAWRAFRSLEVRARKPGGGRPTDLRGPIRPIRFNHSRLLLTDIGGNGGVMVDLDPASSGTVGQLLDFDHEIGPWCVLARSFAVWLARIAAGLEAGRYEFDGYGVSPKGYDGSGRLADWEVRIAEPAAATDQRGAEKTRLEKPTRPAGR